MAPWRQGPAPEHAGADKSLAATALMCRGKWNPKLKVLGHHVSRSSSLLSGTCCPLPGSNPRQRKAACYLHGLVGRLIMLLSSEESPEPQSREWPRSQGEGEVGRPGVSLRQVSTGSFCRDLCWPEPPIGRVWQSSWRSSPPWDTPAASQLQTMCGKPQAQDLASKAYFP